MDAALLARAMSPDLRIGRGLLASHVAGLPGSYLLLTQPEPLAAADPSVGARAHAVAMVDSLAAADLAALEARLPAADRVVGLGGGMCMDAAKSVAWRRGVPLVLAPSIVSVDAPVTNTFAVRRDGGIVYEGFVVAEAIVADLALIAGAPARLNRAGVGDLLSIHTGCFDWALGARAGRIGWDAAIAAAARDALAATFALADDVAAVTDHALASILRLYAQVNTLLLRVGHAGPEEGSEHYFAYHAEAVTGRSFVHGELIGLGTALMAELQGNDAVRVRAFLDRAGVAWHPDALGLDRTTLAGILGGLPAFVRGAGLPHSIIDEADLSAPVIDRLITSLAGAPGGDDARPGATA
ncbi:MAG: iron-containing alcohol dehydrogenase [Chloroflexota bacterium]